MNYQLVFDKNKVKKHSLEGFFKLQMNGTCEIIFDKEGIFKIIVWNFGIFKNNV